jgi:AbrB family transcriptional regulator (stage V sporulation protein T)
MKATGIVRRIDDLGRVVIPKEIRRTMRIREGDPLEIYTEKDGTVIFRKYSQISGIGDFAGQICDTLSKTTGFVAVITDRDSVIAVAGVPRRELADKHISSDMESIMDRRGVYQYREGMVKNTIVEDTDKYFASVASPILAQGDVLGCVILATTDPAATTGDTEYKLIQTIAAFLGKHMET